MERAVEPVRRCHLQLLAIVALVVTAVVAMSVMVQGSTTEPAASRTVPLDMADPNFFPPHLSFLFLFFFLFFFGKIRMKALHGISRGENVDGESNSQTPAAAGPTLACGNDELKACGRPVNQLCRRKKENERKKIKKKKGKREARLE
jgi:hypothetical protein